MKMNTKTISRYISLLCVSTIMVTLIFGVNIQIVHAALNTNLTWGSYPSGWSEDSNGLIGSGSTLGILASNEGSNFTYDVDITLNGSGSDASQGGLIIRSTSTSGQTTYYNSYTIWLHKTSSFSRVELNKVVNGSVTNLASISRTIDWNMSYNLNVEVSGTSIKVYFNNESTACINTTDDTHTTGAVGLFRAGTSVTFNNADAYFYFNTNLMWGAYPSGWSDTTNGLIGSGSTLAIYSDEIGSDFTYKADITLNGSGTQSSQGAFIIRSTSDLSYYNSYVVFLNKTSSIQNVDIQKFNGSGIGTSLAKSNKTLNWDTKYNLKVVTSGSNIKVYFNDESTPCIDINDSTYIAGHYGLFRAGTNVTFDNAIAENTGTTYSLLSSQLGYQTESAKHAYIRDNTANKVSTGTTFYVVNATTGATATSGTVSSWGQKWGSYWWVLDFSSLKTAGDYFIVVGSSVSNAFEIGSTPLMDYDMVDIALNQLDERNNYGSPNTYNLDDTLRYAGKWLTPNGTYSAGIYRDCSSNFAEIESVGMTTIGLIDLYNYQQNHFSSINQQRIKDYIELGADYIVACQRTTTDPATNGRFAHSILVNTFDGAAWAGNVYNWHDMAYAMVVLTKAYQIVNQYDQTKAQTYLAAVEKAYDCATYREYHLSSEYDLAVRDDNYNPSTDYDKAAWSAYVPGYTLNPSTVPAGWNNRFDFTRRFYDKPSTWDEPTTLKTREKLPFLYACALLYEITNETDYLNKAIEFADSIQERQFVDWENPIEGVYGNFYELEGDNTAFSIESGQAGSIHMGNIDNLSVRGFIKLLELVPENQNAAKWYNVVKTFADNYVKNAADINPLGIHPLSMYSDENYGGVKFFMNVLHGATGHYGQVAGDLLEIGNFLNDHEYQDLAVNNLQYFTGLNPGIPNGINKWYAASLLNQVGSSYYNTGGEGIKGGVINGFKAGTNWTLYNINEISDTADIAGWQEDWVAHSHPYVGSVARLEANYNLKVNTFNNGSAVSASVVVSLPEQYNYSTDSSGTVTITNIPSNRQGTVSVTYNGRTISKDIETIGGGKLIWDVDFVKYVDMSLTLPSAIEVGDSDTGTLTVTNRGSSSVSGTANLSASGVTLGSSTVSVSVASDATQNYTINLTGGTKVMPYAVYATLNLGVNKLFKAVNEGKVDGYATNLTWGTFPSGWSQNVNGLEGSGSTLADYSGETGSNFTYKADIALNGSGTQASQGALIIRSTSDSSYYNSYIVFLHKTSNLQRVEIQKFNGSGIGTVLATANKTLEWNTVYNLKVVGSGSNIKVYFNDESTPCIDINDSTHTNGYYGLFRAGTVVTFDNAYVK